MVWSAIACCLSHVFGIKIVLVLLCGVPVCSVVVAGGDFQHACSLLPPGSLASHNVARVDPSNDPGGLPCDLVVYVKSLARLRFPEEIHADLREIVTKRGQEVTWTLRHVRHLAECALALP